MIKDTFDSVFRLGKLERDAPAGELKAKKKTRIKMHATNTERQLKREEEEEAKSMKAVLEEELRQRKRIRTGENKPEDNAQDILII